MFILTSISYCTILTILKRRKLLWNVDLYLFNLLNGLNKAGLKRMRYCRECRGKLNQSSDYDVELRCAFLQAI